MALGPRGIGCTFGPDISKQCNQQNGFEFVVRRAHQLATDAATNGRICPRLYAEEMWEPGTSALWIACWYDTQRPGCGYARGVGADVGECDKGGRSPLYAAASKLKYLMFFLWASSGYHRIINLYYL